MLRYHGKIPRDTLPIIFLYAKDPSTQHFIGYMKLLDQIALFEHANSGSTGVFVS